MEDSRDRERMGRRGQKGMEVTEGMEGGMNIQCKGVSKRMILFCNSQSSLIICRKFAEQISVFLKSQKGDRAIEGGKIGGQVGGELRDGKTIWKRKGGKGLTSS
jgi:hypothetical protein